MAPANALQTTVIGSSISVALQQQPPTTVAPTAPGTSGNASTTSGTPVLATQLCAWLAHGGPSLDGHQWVPVFRNQQQSVCA